MWRITSCRALELPRSFALPPLLSSGQIHVCFIPTVSPLLTLLSSRNTLLLQSLPTNTPFWQVNSRRRKDDTCVDTTARGIIERLSRLPRCLPSDGGSSR